MGDYRVIMGDYESSWTITASLWAITNNFKGLQAGEIYCEKMRGPYSIFFWL